MALFNPSYGEGGSDIDREGMDSEGKDRWDTEKTKPLQQNLS